MEEGLIRLECLDGEPLVYLTGTKEDGAAELHPPFHDPGSIGTNDPVEGRGRILLGCFRRGVLQGDFVKAEADFCV